MDEIKTIEELHQMTKEELKTYSHEVWVYMRKIDAIVTYMDKIGTPKYLPAPVEVEYTECCDEDDCEHTEEEE